MVHLERKDVGLKKRQRRLLCINATILYASLRNGSLREKQQSLFMLYVPYLFCIQRHSCHEGPGVWEIVKFKRFRNGITVYFLKEVFFKKQKQNSNDNLNVKQPLQLAITNNYEDNNRVTPTCFQDIGFPTRNWAKASFRSNSVRTRDDDAAKERRLRIDDISCARETFYSPSWNAISCPPIIITVQSLSWPASYCFRSLYQIYLA